MDWGEWEEEQVVGWERDGGRRGSRRGAPVPSYIVRTRRIWREIGLAEVR